MLDTRVVDNPEGYRQSKIRAVVTQTGTPSLSAFVEPSPAKSAKKAKSKLSEVEGVQTVTLLAEGSTNSDPSFVKVMTEGLLLSADRKRLNEIGHVKSAEWSLAHAYQVSVLYVVSEISLYRL